MDSDEAPVSVVIPTYNRAHLLARAVTSALAAIQPSDEIIVVDDGSTDDTEAALSAFRHRVRYVRQANGGAGRARNRGVEEAQNPLVAFLDSDDEWMADRLLLGRRLLASRPDVLFCFSDFRIRRQGGNESPSGLAEWNREPPRWDEILGPAVAASALFALPPGRADFRIYVGNLYAALIHVPYVSVITTLVRREALGESLRFPEDLPTYEDWEWCGRLARKGPAACLACDTAWNWGHPGPRLTRVDPYVAAGARLTLLERVWGSDPTFLREHRAEYETLRSGQRVIRARWLLGAGRTAEARRELDLAGGGPLHYRLAARLPRVLVRWILQRHDQLRFHEPRDPGRQMASPSDDGS